MLFYNNKISNFQKKYLKYKIKFLELKKNLKGKGTQDSSEELDNILNKYSDGKKLDESEIEIINNYFYEKLIEHIPYINTEIDDSFEKINSIHENHAGDIKDFERECIDDLMFNMDPEFTWDDNKVQEEKQKLQKLFSLWKTGAEIKKIMDWKPADLTLMFEYHHDEDEHDISWIAYEIEKKVQIDKRKILTQFIENLEKNTD